MLSLLSTLKPGFPLVATGIAMAILLAACSGNNRISPTATAIRSPDAPPVPRESGVFHISPNTVLWITKSREVLIDADGIAAAHPYVLNGQGVTFPDSPPGAAVNADESVIALPVHTSSGLGGVTLVRADGHSMALHLYGGPESSISSIKFMPEFALTLLAVSDGGSGSIIAFNNYGARQFELPVADSSGQLRYSADELGYMVIDRRPVEQELELVSLVNPDDSVVFHGGQSREDDELYRQLSAVIAGWN